MLEIDELHCMKCHDAFNLMKKVPRILPECGHTLCTSCITDLLKSSPGKPLECPEDK